MHEQGIADDLVTGAERAAGGNAASIVSLRLEIGALTGVTKEGLAAALQDRMLARWGRVPVLVVEPVDDIDSDHAASVRLLSLTVED